MKKILLAFAILLSFTQLVSNPQKKSKELCECLQKAKKTNEASDKKVCLSLRESHVASLKKGSKGYESYLTFLQKCEEELSDLPKPKTNLTTAEKISDVCECFKNSNPGNRMGCFKLQSDYGKTFENSDERTEFNQKTNSCG